MKGETVYAIEHNGKLVVRRYFYLLESGPEGLQFVYAPEIFPTEEQAINRAGELEKDVDEHPNFIRDFECYRDLSFVVVELTTEVPPPRK